MSNDIGVDDRLDAFYSDLGSVDLQPLWTQARNLLPATPKPEALPWLWQGETLRRSPHERATSSRSSVAANGGCSPCRTQVSAARRSRRRRCGARSRPSVRTRALPRIGTARPRSGSCSRAAECGRRSTATRATMHPGDLVLTPAWTFHDHTNDGDEPMIWFDGLDLPIIAALDASFFENHPDLNQPVRGFDLSEQMYGAGGRVPYGTTNASPHSPLLVYRWKHSDAFSTSCSQLQMGRWQASSSSTRPQVAPHCRP